MSNPVSRADLREDLNAFLNHEFKQVFQEVLSSQMQHEFARFFGRPAKAEYHKQMSFDSSDALGNETAFPPALSKQASIRSSSIKSNNRVSLSTRIEKMSSTGTLEETQESVEVKPMHRAESERVNHGSYTRLLSRDFDDSAITKSEPLSQSPPNRRRSLISDVGSRASARSSSRLRKTSTLGVGMPLEVYDFIGDSTQQNNALTYLPIITGFVLLLNSFCVGWETNHRILYHGDLPPYSNVVERFFCIFFVLEICVRLRDGCGVFFLGEDKEWNIFDFTIVFMQVVEQLSLLLKEVHWDLAPFRMLRLLRIVRILRVVRIFNQFDELHLIIASIRKTIAVLLWFMLMLLLLIYMFGVLLLQLILDTAEGRFQFKDDKLQYWFGSVPRAIFTLFEAIVSGVSWDEVVNPLMRNTSPLAAIVFSIYIIVAMLAVLNMLTGVFVDRSMKFVKEDRDFHMAAKIHNLFMPSDSEDYQIDWPTFQEQIRTHNELLEYMEELGLKPDEAQGLFHLLDDDESGTVSSSEIVDGCLRLRGQARALDVALLHRDLRLLMSKLLSSKAMAHCVDIHHHHKEHERVDNEV